MENHVDKGSVVFSLKKYGAALIGYPERAHVVAPEDLVLEVLHHYIRSEPRFVEALCAIVTQEGFDFKLLHKKASNVGQCHTAHWLLLELEEAFRETGHPLQLSIMQKALPLFSQDRVSLEEALRHETPYRRRKVNEYASPAARLCGVPVVYTQADFQKKVRLYCDSARPVMPSGLQARKA